MKKRMLCMTVALMMLLTGTQLAVAEATTATNLLTNGDFHDGLNGWSHWDDMNMTVNADERAVLSDSSKKGAFRSPVEIESGATYELSFKMMNSVDDVLTIHKDIYMVGSAIADGDNDSQSTYSEFVRNQISTTYAFGDAVENPTWEKNARTYKGLFSVPSKDVTHLGFIFQIKADPDFAIDDISIVKVSDKTIGTVNGTFDAGSADAVSGWSTTNMTPVIDSEGNRYLQSNGAVGDVRQDNVLVPRNSTVQLSFRMKNTIADAVELDYRLWVENSLGTYAEDNFSSAVQNLRNNMSSYPICIGEASDGNTWKTYTLNVPIPYAAGNVPVPIRIWLKPKAGDATIAIDDVNVTFVDNDPDFFINGDFSHGNVTEANDGKIGFFKVHGGATVGTVKEEANGNRYVHITDVGNNQGLWLNPFVIGAGRYKLSYKVKVKGASADDPKTLGLSMSIGLAAHTAVEGYMNIFAADSAGVNIPVTAGFEDEWETKNVYFTVKEDISRVLCFVPFGGGGTGEYYFDDISLKKDISSLQFVSASEAFTLDSSENAGIMVKGETVKGSAVTNLKTVGAGGTVPVSFHYVTETPGAEEEMMLAIGVYEKDGNTKRLIDVIVKSGKTVIDSVTGGANANGVICLSGAVTLPETLSENHTVEVMTWKGADTLKPYMDKQVIRYE